MKIKTSELTHDALVAAVATCLGYTELHKIEGRMPHEPQFAMMPPNRDYGVMELWEIGSDCDWEWFGPIIEKEKIELGHMYSDRNFFWVATRSENGAISEEQGPTPLVAAMRCYVASQLGDEVDVPDELVDKLSTSV